MENDQIFTMKDFLDSIYSNKGRYFQLLVASFFLSLVIFFITPKKYIAEISITQSSPGMDAGLGSVTNLASSFGINLGNIQGDIFYLPNIINSKSLKKDIVLKKRWIDNKETTLLDDFNKKSILNFIEKSDEEKLINAIDIFSENMILLEDQNSGMITVKFISSSPDLSLDIVNDIESNVNIFLNSGLNLQASSMLDLINGEIDLTKKNLSSAEDKLANFVENNKAYLNSPNLLLEFARLERDVNIFNQKYLNLIIQQTMAMIEEKKELPRLNIISEPISNPNPYSPDLVYIFLFVGMFNIILMTSYILYNTKRYQ